LRCRVSRAHGDYHFAAQAFRQRQFCADLNLGTVHRDTTTARERREGALDDRLDVGAAPVVLRQEVVGRIRFSDFGV